MLSAIRYSLTLLILTSTSCIVTGEGPAPTLQGDDSGVAVVFDFPGDVIEVNDGDTLDVDVNGTVFEIRVFGVNTPELFASGGPAPYAQAAQAFTLASVSDRVGLEFDDPACYPPTPASRCYDIYDRLLAYVRTQSDKDLGAELVVRGLARVYDTTFARRSAYEALQAQAQAAGVGMWSD